jgi:hypothetical protein
MYWKFADAPETETVMATLLSRNAANANVLFAANLTPNVVSLTFSPAVPHKSSDPPNDVTGHVAIFGAPTGTPPMMSCAVMFPGVLQLPFSLTVIPANG